MARVQLAVSMAAILLCVPDAALADDFKTLQLEQDVRALQRQVQSLSRQVDDMRLQLTRSADRPKSPPAATVDPASTDGWLDAAKWRRLKPGMSELEVISALGPPTSMRSDNGGRVLFYAMEIGTSGFLGGSVRLRDRVVVEVQVPALQ